MKNPVSWFELPALDLARAKKFYEEVFGFEMTPETNAGYEMLSFPMQRGGIGATGGLMKGFGYKPSLTGTTVYLDTNMIDEMEKKIVIAGGKIHVPKKDIGEYGYISIFEDSEGNRVGLYQRK
ncbi:MAG: VOC family protein [Patescibacteria group bacterium]